MTEVRVFNYPWSGRLGVLCKCCPYCGESGAKWRISSRGRCCNCTGGEEMLPGMEASIERTAEERARAWCRKNGMDYDGIVAYFAEKYGEIWQENPARFQDGQDTDDDLRCMFPWQGD